MDIYMYEGRSFKDVILTELQAITAVLDCRKVQVQYKEKVKVTVVLEGTPPETKEFICDWFKIVMNLKDKA